MPEKHYTLEFNSLQIAYAIKINDILIETNQFHDLPRGGSKINQWVYNGENSYEISLWVNPKFESAIEDQNFRFKIVEHCGSDGELVPATIAAENWNYADNTQFPVRIHGTFSLDIPYGNWIWLDGDIINEENLDRDSLLAYMHQLHSYMSNRDYLSLEPLLKVKATELGSSFYIDETERLQDQKEFFTEELFGHPEWGMQPLDLEGMLIRYHAQNRLIEILSKNGKSPLRSNSMDGCSFSLKLFLCRKNNQWILCR